MAGRAFAHPETADAERELPTVSTPAPVRRKAAPLVVGSADDRAELEADRVADEVISRLQGGESGETHVHDGCHGVARTAAPVSGAPEVGYAGGEISDDLSSRIESKRGSGSALDDGVRRRMEAGFGRSLGHVRVHTDGESAKLNRSISARAFTTGNDIFFGAGEYRPDTAAGEKVLAHELAHTQQQGAGARRVHRLWDIKAKNLGLGRAEKIDSLEERPIWFIEDRDGDRIVVKSEDQPTGLGLLAGALHKNVTDIKSVKQRKLERNDILAVDNLIEIASMTTGLNKTWKKRGAYLKATDDTVDTTDEDTEVAKTDAIKQLNNRGKSVIAMTVAEGVGANKTAPTTGGPGAKTSRFRSLISDPDHAKLLGKMTAVDFFFGNTDRVFNGNLGNWFYNPAGVITLIDHVDPGAAGETGTKDKFASHQEWVQSVVYTIPKKFQDNGALGVQMAKGLAQGADKAGDDEALAWIKEGVNPDKSGPIRADVIGAHMLAGAKEGFAHIAKVFSTTKWSLRSKQAHKAKKSIRSAAKAGGAEDGQGDSYYHELKARAQWIKANCL